MYFLLSYLWGSVTTVEFIYHNIRRPQSFQKITRFRLDRIPSNFNHFSSKRDSLSNPSLQTYFNFKLVWDSWLLKIPQSSI